MFYHLGIFIGAVLLIWLFSAIFTFVQKLITKRVTRNIVVITTVTAGVLCSVSALFSESKEALTMSIAAIIGTLVVTRIRLDSLKKKKETKPPPAATTPVCPTCGGPLTYIEQHKRWYCHRCQKYA